MSEHTYTIRGVFLIPLGVDVFLLFCLWVISMLPEGSTTEQIVFASFFFPSSYLFLECLFRRVKVDDRGIVFRRLWRKKRICWEGITHVGGLRLQRQVYILLSTVKGLFIVSSAYGGYPKLREEILSHLDPSKVEEEVRLQEGHSAEGIAHGLTAWIAAVLMVGIIVIKMLH